MLDFRKFVTAIDGAIDRLSRAVRRPIQITTDEHLLRAAAYQTIEAHRARSRAQAAERRAAAYAQIALLSTGALAIVAHAAILWFCL